MRHVIGSIVPTPASDRPTRSMIVRGINGLLIRLGYSSNNIYNLSILLMPVYLFFNQKGESHQT